MRAGRYVTIGNIGEKGREWLARIRPFYYDRKNFILMPSRCALIIVDMQNYFASPGGGAYLSASDAIIPKISVLLDFYRKNDFLRVFTRHCHIGEGDLGVLGRFWGDYIKEGTRDSEIIAELSPQKDEKVIIKNRYDAFFGTELEGFLRSSGVEQVLITGVMTHLCCETTARSAFVRDFEVFFAVDGTATATEEMHIATLMNLANGFAVPMLCDEAAGK